MPGRLTCLVPFCRHTRGDWKNDPLPSDLSRMQWVCAEHWRAVPRQLRAIHRRAERAYVSARASMDAASTLMSVTPAPRPTPLTEGWRTAGVRYKRARARADRIWNRCKRHAIEAAAGIAS